MPLRRFSPGLKAQFAFGMVFLFVQPDASAADISAQQIGGVNRPGFPGEYFICELRL
ncbi:hypothetical protein ACM3AK_005248, partial [Escherichia coli]